LKQPFGENIDCPNCRDSLTSRIVERKSKEKETNRTSYQNKEIAGRVLLKQLTKFHLNIRLPQCCMFPLHITTFKKLLFTTKLQFIEEIAKGNVVCNLVLKSQNVK